MIKKTYLKWLFLILTFAVQKAFSQTDEAGIKAAINNLFKGMKNTDTTLIRSAFAEKSVLQTVEKNKEGKTFVLTELLDSFLVSLAYPHTQTYDERIRFDVIRVDGDLALVWAPYSFYLGEKFSHCGVDSFLLVRLNGIWKIQYLIDTRRKQGCESR